MISKIHLNKANYKDYELESPDFILSQLGRINIFIGQNNTGKSRFLRSLFSDDKFEFELRQDDLGKIITLLNEKYYELNNVFNLHNIRDIESFLQRLGLIKDSFKKFKFNHVKQDLNNIRALAQDFSNMTQIGSWSPAPNRRYTEPPNSLIPNINTIGIQIIDILNETYPKDFDYILNRIYIPILRGLRPIDNSNVDRYKERTVNDYFQTDHRKNIGDEIFTGYSLYSDTKNYLLGNKPGRDRIKSFEAFLSECFFDKKEVTLIPDLKKDVLLIGIGDEEKHVYELGDGIQSIIILLYPLFFSQERNLLVFIEEPENYMHPGLQRVFLETLMRPEFKNFQYFFTTHSNHFLDISLDIDDISIYLFNKLKVPDNNRYKFKIENTSNADIKILDLIGARNSSVFLSNCTIWVEGITDRLYLRKYLEVYQINLINKGKIVSSFKEDSNFSFIEYGGGNIVHWSFTNELGWDKIQTSRISSKIFVIVDKDNSEEKPNSAKAIRINDLKSKLKDKFRVVNGREIENTLSLSIIFKTIQKLEGENINIQYDPKKVSYEKYKDKRIGNYIQNHFIGLKRQFEAKSGTLEIKLDFCKVAINQINSIEDLSAEGLALAKDIFNFIDASNS